MKLDTLLARSQMSLALLGARDTGAPPNRTIELSSGQYGTTFNAEVTFGNQTFKLLVDTGSSDTYVMKDDFVCIDDEHGNKTVPQAECGFTETYTHSRTYSLIPDQTFGVKYGDGIACGNLAHEDVTLAGVTVPSQVIGVANHTTAMGDGINSGVLGLAYPSLTSAHSQNHTNNQTYWYGRKPYSPLFNTMYDRGLIEENFFSIALAHTPRNASTDPVFGGYLTLGDLPPVAHEDKFASVPVEILDAIPTDFTSGKRTRSYWAFTVDSFTWSNDTEPRSTNDTKIQVFTDTGNNINILPSAVVDPINAMFDPKPFYNETNGVSFVPCDAKAPAVGVEIGGQTFYHNGQDLVYQVDDGICATVFMSSEFVAKNGIELDLHILGSPFLKNVVSVHDFGKNEMRFAQRTD